MSERILQDVFDSRMTLVRGKTDMATHDPEAGQGTSKEANPSATREEEDEEDEKMPPPKWKLFIVVTIAVYPCVLANNYAMASPVMTRKVGDFVFALFLHLATVVMVVTYCFMPLLMQFLFGSWVTTRVKVPEREPFRSLHLGLDLFQPPPTPLTVDPSRVDRLEGKVGTPSFPAPPHMPSSHVMSRRCMTV